MERERSTIGSGECLFARYLKVSSRVGACEREKPDGLCVINERHRAAGMGKRTNTVDT